MEAKEFKGVSGSRNNVTKEEIERWKLFDNIVIYGKDNGDVIKVWEPTESRFVGELHKSEFEGDLVKL